MKTFLALLLVSFLAFGFSPAHADLGASGIQMGTAQCPTSEQINCNNPVMDQEKIITISNQCITMMGIQGGIMQNFQRAGEFENCVTASQPAKDPSGFNTWAICCVKPDGDTCRVYCTRYLDQKK